MSDEGATEIREIRGHICNAQNDFPTMARCVNNCLDRLEAAHAQEVAQLQAERTRLQRARIGDSEIIGRWQCQAEKAEAHVAQLHAQLDRAGIGRADNLFLRVEELEAQRDAARVQVAQLTARLRELRELWIQGIVYPSDAMARAFQYRNEDDGRILCVDCDQPIHDPHATGCRVGRFTQLIVGATDGLPSPPVP
jgi:hypothetical protein